MKQNPIKLNLFATGIFQIATFHGHKAEAEKSMKCLNQDLRTHSRKADAFYYLEYKLKGELVVYTALPDHNRPVNDPAIVEILEPFRQDNDQQRSDNNFRKRGGKPFG